MMREQRFILFLFFLIVLMLGCSDPLSEEEKKAVVTTLFTGFLESGEYSFFWNGKNEAGENAQAGTYYARLYSLNFTHQIEMSAWEGGSGVSNDSSYIAPGFQPITHLLQNHPNPFLIRSGTNIPFTLSTSVTVELTIRNQK